MNVKVVDKAIKTADGKMSYALSILQSKLELQGMPRRKIIVEIDRLLIIIERRLAKFGLPNE